METGIHRHPIRRRNYVTIGTVSVKAIRVLWLLSSHQAVRSSLYHWANTYKIKPRESAPSHKFDKPGTYTVKLVAQNSKGANTANATIEVNPISEIKPMDVYFTPNGDNNKTFFFLQNRIASIDVTIYDSGGLPVYTLNTVGGNWDGKLSNGNDAPKARYYYVGQALGVDGMPYVLKGSIDLR